MSMGTLGSAAHDIGGRLLGPDRSYDSVSTDTRTLTAGQLFFALRGERFDAADFVADAALRGAAGAVVERYTPASLPQIEGADTREAHWQIAHAGRAQIFVPMNGFTGSQRKSHGKGPANGIHAGVFAGCC